MLKLEVTRRSGIAGQYSLSATTGGETYTFVGSVYGGPVVMIINDGPQTFVHNPGRFGAFGEDWVRKFLA